MIVALYLVLILILVVQFFHARSDAPGGIATIVATRVLPLRWALLFSVAFNVVGVFLGTAVAHTLGRSLLDLEMINLSTLVASLLSIGTWGAIAKKVDLPVSKSQALISGLAGAAVATGGMQALYLSGWSKILFGILVSTLGGFSIAWILGKLVRTFFYHRPAAPSRRLFNVLQIFSSFFFSLAHGLNDGQKFVGVFCMALFLGGQTQTFETPLWVLCLGAAMMGLGTLTGKNKVGGLIGERNASVVSWQGFCAEAAAAGIISGVSIWGVPLSTSHTLTTSLMGASGSRRLSSVRWRFVGIIVQAWGLTFPACAVIAYVYSKILNYIF